MVEAANKVVRKKGQELAEHPDRMCVSVVIQMTAAPVEISRHRDRYRPAAPDPCTCALMAAWRRRGVAVV